MMSCLKVAPGVVICGALRMDHSRLRRRLTRCPVDERITEWVVLYEDNPWYPDTWWCTSCGEKASQDGMFPRPFRRGWRRQQQAESRALYAVATYGPAPAIDPAWFASSDPDSGEEVQ